MQQIPTGRVSTYGDLANALGNPFASRAIRQILGKNPHLLIILCHRVVKSDGSHGGYMYGIAQKKVMLEKEGMSFVGGFVSGFKDLRVYPQNTKAIPKVVTDIQR